MTSSCPNTTEGVVELVQLPTVDVEHLEVVLGFEPQLTFSCQNLNIRKYQEQKEVPLVTSHMKMNNCCNWTVLQSYRVVILLLLTYHLCKATSFAYDALQSTTFAFIILKIEAVFEKHNVEASENKFPYFKVNLIFDQFDICTKIQVGPVVSQ